MKISKLRKRIVLKNGTILDPLAGTQKKGDILIKDGKIEKIGKVKPPNAADIIAVSYTHLTLPTTPYV